MNKKDRKRRLKEKEAFEKNNRKIKFAKGITNGGPAPGTSFIANSTRNKYIVVLTTDPIYCAAVYIYTNKLTASGEIIAAFSHCIPRSK